MATITVHRANPIIDLCGTCRNRIIVTSFDEDADQETNDTIQVYKCMSFALPDLNLAELSDFQYQDDKANVIEIKTMITNCTVYEPGAKVLINIVSYDGANVTINYTLTNTDGTDTLDFFINTEVLPIATLANPVDGTYDQVIPKVLADGIYSFFTQMRTDRTMSLRFPIVIATST